MRSARQALTIVLLLTAVLFFSNPAHAILFSDPVDNQGSIVVGNLTFSNFFDNSTSGNMSPSEADITVTTNGLIISGNPNCCGGDPESGSWGYQVQVTNGSINAVTNTVSLLGTEGTGNLQWGG